MPGRTRPLVETTKVGKFIYYWFFSRRLTVANFILVAIQLPPVKNPTALPLKFPRNRDTHAGRPLSSSSDSSARSGSSSNSSSSSSTGPAIADDVPIVFGHNPSNPSDQSRVLPEAQELPSKSYEPYLDQGLQLWSAKHTAVTQFLGCHWLTAWRLTLIGEIRSCGIFLFLPFPFDWSLDDRSVRESWQSADSLNSTADDLLDGLGLALPHPIKEQIFRASIASISTFMTTDSADAVIPHTPRGGKSPQQSFFRSNLRISTPLSISDFDVYSDFDDNFSVLGK